MSRVNIFVVLFFEKYVWECLKNFKLDFIKQSMGGGWTITFVCTRIHSFVGNSSTATIGRTGRTNSHTMVSGSALP